MAKANTVNKTELMAYLIREIDQCRQCPGLNLVEKRTRAVPGRGRIDAVVMLVGLNPGGPGIEFSEPFAGGSGRLLNDALEKARVGREDIFITNIVHCRLYVRPTRRIVDNCRSFVQREIEIVAPKLIIPLGKEATEWFLGPIKRLGDVIGKTFWEDGRAICPMFHPAYIMRGARKLDDYTARLASLVATWLTLDDSGRSEFGKRGK